MWHKLSGMPDNVTDEGAVVAPTPAARLQAEKHALRQTIARLRGGDNAPEVRSLARLAQSYLLAGDVETSLRYISQAEALAVGRPPG